MKHRIARILPHLTIVLSLMTLTFFGIDRVNVNMAFMTSEMSKWLFAALAVLSIVTSFLLLAFQWRADARDARKHLRRVEREQRAADELFRMHKRPAPHPDAEPDDETSETSDDADTDTAEPSSDADDEAKASTDTEAEDTLATTDEETEIAADETEKD